MIQGCLAEFICPSWLG